MAWFPRFGGALAQLFVPSSCASCGGGLRQADAGRLCAACIAAVQRIATPFCGTCGVPLRAADGTACCEDCRGGRQFGSARAYGVFDGLLRDLVTKLKYGGRRELAEPLGQLVLDVAQDALTIQDYEAIVPVPLHRDRLRERGFNQAFLLARPLAASARIPIVAALGRTIQTQAQVGLSGDARRLNVRNIFAIEPRSRERVARRNVLLIDDVMTTGATVDECARVLKAAGVARVDAVAVARTP